MGTGLASFTENIKTAWFFVENLIFEIMQSETREPAHFWLEEGCFDKKNRNLMNASWPV
jgi:hypothetical protein